MIKRIRSHALRRIRERYNINLSKLEYDNLCDDIQNNRISDTLKFYRRKSRRLSLWLLIIEDKLVLVYYDKSIHQIVTFLEVRNVKQMQFIFSRR